MRNNRHIIMIAWVMAVIMVLCTMPLAMADGIQLGGGYVDDDFAITNDNAFVTVTYKTEDGQTVDIAQADRSKSYKLVLTVEEDEETVPFPTEGCMVYKLPEEVESAESNAAGNNVVAWTYYSTSRELEFTWAGNSTTAFTAEISVKLANIFPLYNMVVAKINGSDTWYRLGKSTIKTSKPYTAYNQGTGLVASEYEIDQYDFSGITFTSNGITYIAKCDVDIENPVPYFTVKLEKLEVSKTKGIGGLIDKDPNRPRWAEGLAESEKYNEPNTNCGYHANYRITFHEADAPATVHALYNFVGDNTNRKYDRKGTYYRLNKTQILAKEPRTYKSGDTVPDGEYQLIPEGDYDFTGVVLNINGREYKYSSTEPTGLYEDSFTVELDRILVKDRMHGNANWYKNDAGWVGDAKSTFTQEELNNNNIFGYHRDYYFYLYEGNAYSVNTYDGGEKISTVLVEKNHVADLPVPEKAGYQFVGWKAEDGTDFDLATPVTGSIKLIAQWEVDNTNTVETIVPNDQGITYHSSLAQYKKVFVGTQITISADIEGYEQPYSVQWVYEDPAQPGVFHTITGATETEYTFILDMVNSTYTYYITVIPQS